MATARKLLAKVVHLSEGVDLMRGIKSIHAKDSILEVTNYGIIATSKKNKRVIIIPWANIKGAELFPDGAPGQVESE